MWFILSNIDKGIVLSSSLIRNLTPFVDVSSIHVVFNFAEDGLRNPRLNKSFELLKIIYLGNLIPEKGVFDLLSALLVLKKKGVVFRAKIAGEIDLSSKSKFESFLLELGDGVEYQGVVRGSKKRNLLEWGNVFVFPTYYPQEGQPIAILEAMTTGNVVVTTRHAGIPDIVTEKNAFFVDKKCPDQIDAVFARFYKDRLSFIEKSANNIVKSAEFTEDKFVSNIIHVINA